MDAIDKHECRGGRLKADGAVRGMIQSSVEGMSCIDSTKPS